METPEEGVKICSKLLVKTSERRQLRPFGAFFVNLILCLFVKFI